MKEIDFNDINEKRDYYFRTRELANANVIESAKRLDYLIFSFTGGALLLLANIVGKFTSYRLILLAALIFLILALLMHVLSYEESIKYNKKVVKKLDDWFNAGLSSNSFELPHAEEYEGRSKLDRLAFCLMIFGIILIASFIAINTLV